MQTAEKVAPGAYADVNGLRLYYEIHGAGEPLVLLHGAFGTIEMFAALLPALAASRQVIAVELQGHGHTADIERPLSLEAMADDVGALIRHLGLERADLLGYSMGGNVALHTAMRHPEVVRKLIVVSIAIKSEAWYPQARAGFQAISGEAARTWTDSPVYQAYASVAPHPEAWPALADKVGAMVRREYDWSPAVAGLNMPTLIVVGDADGMSPAHAVEFFQLLGGGQREGSWDGTGMPNAQLAIFPGTTHYDILFSPLLTPAVEAFLNKPAPAGN